jgi:hypothetical protein
MKHIRNITQTLELDIVKNLSQLISGLSFFLAISDSKKLILTYDINPSKIGIEYLSGFGFYEISRFTNRMYEK